jgi:hypothetical protein
MFFSILPTEVFGRHVVQARMRANGVVVPPPFLNHNPRLGPTPEPFHRQTFVTKFAVKTLVQTVLPWLPGLNQLKHHGIGGHVCNPLSPREDHLLTDSMLPPTLPPDCELLEGCPPPAIREILFFIYTYVIERESYLRFD